MSNILWSILYLYSWSLWSSYNALMKRSLQGCFLSLKQFILNINGVKALFFFLADVTLCCMFKLHPCLIDYCRVVTVLWINCRTFSFSIPFVKTSWSQWIIACVQTFFNYCIVAALAPEELNWGTVTQLRLKWSFMQFPVDGFVIFNALLIFAYTGLCLGLWCGYLGKWLWASADHPRGQTWKHPGWLCWLLTAGWTGKSNEVVLCTIRFKSL